MTATIERELGGLRSDVQNLTRAVERLVEKFDGHVDDDNERFGDIDRWQARHEGGRSMASAWRHAITGLVAAIAGAVAGRVPFPGIH